MKNKINNITKMGMHLGLCAITALCMASPVHGGSSRPSHGGGSGGGLPFYATVSTVSQLIADINYANSVGGAITINLAPGAIFDLTSANNTTDGGNGLPVIGGTKAVALTILGNGDTIRRIAAYSRKSGYPTNPFRLFDVAPGASLTLDHVTLQGAWASAILNYGTLNVINGSTLSDTQGSGISNSGGTVTVSNSTLSHNYGGIYNGGGTVTIINSTLYDNGNGISNYRGTVTVSNSTLSSNGGGGDGGGIYNGGGTVMVSLSTLYNNEASFGGGIYNDSNGTVAVDNSTLSNNAAFFNSYANPGFGGLGGGIYNNTGTVTISNSILSGNAAYGGDPEIPTPTGGIGGGIYNDSQGTVTVENSSSITGNIGADAYNLGLFYLDSTSTITSGVGPTSATPF